jgi:hypothetical protein
MKNVKSYLIGGLGGLLLAGFLAHADENCFNYKGNQYCEAGQCGGPNLLLFKRDDGLQICYDKDTGTVSYVEKGGTKLTDPDIIKIANDIAKEIEKHLEEKEIIPEFPEEQKPKAESYPTAPTTVPAQSYPTELSRAIEKIGEEIGAVEAVAKEILENYSIGTIYKKGEKIFVNPNTKIEIEVIYKDGKKEEKFCEKTCEITGDIEKIKIGGNEYKISELPEKPLLIGLAPPGEFKLDIDRIGAENDKFAGRGGIGYKDSKTEIGVELVKDGTGSGISGNIEIKPIGVEGGYVGIEKSDTQEWSQTSEQHEEGTEEGIKIISDITTNNWENTDITNKNEIWFAGLKFEKDPYSGLFRVAGSSYRSHQLSVGGSDITGSTTYCIPEIDECIVVPVDENVSIAKFFAEKSNWLGAYTEQGLKLGPGEIEIFAGYGERRGKEKLIESINGEGSEFGKRELEPLTIAGIGWNGKIKKDIQYSADIYTLQGDSLPRKSRFNFNAAGLYSKKNLLIGVNTGQNSGSFGAGVIFGLKSNPELVKNYLKKMIEYRKLTIYDSAEPWPETRPNAGLRSFLGLPKRIEEFYLRDVFEEALDGGLLFAVEAREPSILGARLGIGKKIIKIPLDVLFSGEFGLSSGNQLSDKMDFEIIYNINKNISIGLDVENIMDPTKKDTFFIGPRWSIKW